MVRHGSKGSAAGAELSLGAALRAGRSRDYKKAAAILEELLSHPTAPPETVLYLGRSLHALGESGRALACFNEYARLKPRSADGYFFAGRTCLSLGMPRRAVDYFDRARQCRPAEPEITAFLGIACLKSRHSSAAVEYLQQAVEAAAGADADSKPRSKAVYQRIYRAYINALFVRGIRLCRNEEYDLGAQMLRFVLENGPAQAESSPLLHLELGRAARELGYLDEALEHYSRAADLAPKDRSIRWYRASILMALGRKDEALAEIRALRGGPDSSSPFGASEPWNSESADLFMIRAFLDQGDTKAAQEAAKSWLGRRRRAGIAADREDAAVHVMFAEALRKSGSYAAALNHLDRAAEVVGPDLSVSYGRISAAWETENWPLLASAIKAAARQGGDAALLERFSLLCEARGFDSRKNTVEAAMDIIGRLQQAIRRFGPDTELFYALAERCLAVGLLDEALHWFRNCLKLNGRHERAALGEIAALEALIAEADDDAARSTYEDGLGQAYRRYLDTWPDNHVIRRERALWLIHSFQWQEAAADLEILLARESANASLRRVLAYCYRKTGRYREAALFLKGLLKETPRDSGLILEFSGCLERAGAAVYAAAVLDNAVRLLPGAADLHIARGLVHSRQKRTEKAFDCFREAAAAAPQDPRPWRCMAALAKSLGDVSSASSYTAKAAFLSRHE